jgi:8-hydroxy-5-deazaflavin:NADPH oxidoreductase
MCRSMKVTVVGRGNVGGGLAELWRSAGHEVQELGKDGGDASDSDAVLVAVPSNAIADALGKVTGLDGKVMLDATNALEGRNEEYDSLAAEVKAVAGGPTAKAFNLNFARAYDAISAQPVKPSMAWAGEDDAREVAEQLIRDAGYEPTYVGGLDKARTVEDSLGLVFSVSQAADGPVFYRFWKPGDLG